MLMRARIPVMSLAVLFAALALACQDEGSALVAPEDIGIQAAAGANPGPGVVKSVNGLTGDVNIAAGDNITVTESNNAITIAATGTAVLDIENVFQLVSFVDQASVAVTTQCPPGKEPINGGYNFDTPFLNVVVTANSPVSQGSFVRIQARDGTTFSSNLTV